MSPVIAILVGVVAAQHGIQTDSTLVLREARRLVAAQYDTRNSHFLDEPCEASAFASCMHGDWSCTDFTCPLDLSQRRRRLIEQLDDLASSAGNSAWLYRQRVALAVKNQEPDRAMEIAGTCDGREWWCMALRGFASHQVLPGTGFESFDSAFALLQAHPERLPNGEFAWGLGPVARCTWTDVRSVAPAELVDQVLGWGCPSGNELRERFWWLADPLWTQDGNERYAEHLARHVMIRLDLDVLRAVTEARGGTRIEDWMWNAVDLHEAYGFALRQGFPNSRRRMTNRRPGQRVAGYRGTAPYVGGGYSFAPSADMFRAPLATRPDDWTVERQESGCTTPWTERAIVAGNTRSARTWLGQGERLEDCGTERMVVAEHWHTLDQQTAAFRRTDRIFIVSAGWLPEDLRRDGSLEPAFAIGDPDDLQIRLASAPIDSAGVIRSRILASLKAYVASLEVVGTQHVGRARFGISLPPLTDGFGLSSAALVNPRMISDSLPIEAALLPSLAMPMDTGHVGLYLEVYGVAADAPLDVSLRVEKTSAGFLTRIGRFLGIAPTESAIQISWVDASTGGDPIRQVFFDFASRDLGSGTHRLTVEVGQPQGATARTELDITVG